MRDNDRVITPDGKKVDLWAIALADKAASGLADDDPRWIREYLGRWCPSDDARVYHLSEDRDLWSGDLPSDHRWNYVLGADFGHKDPFALSVVAWSETCPVLYHVADYRAPGLTIPQMAEAIERYQKRWGPFTAMIGDPGNYGHALIATLNEEYGCYMEYAEKRDKLDYIALLNSDLISGRLKVLRGSFAHQEMLTLLWQAGTNRMVENKATPNHACDALLYTWRYCYHHFSAPKERVIEVGTPEYWERYEQDQFERAIIRRNNEHELGWAVDLVEDPDDFDFGF